MWKKRKMSDNHYTDEDLLCHLDGELTKRARRVVSEHLDVCWLCRTRRERLENQIRLVSAGAQSFRIRPDWLDDTKRRLTAFQAEFERGIQSSSRAGAFRLRPWLFAGFASVLAATFAIGVMRVSIAPSLPSPISVIRNIDQSAARVNGQTIHQVFKVDEFQVAPKGPARRTRLEIWSDAGSHRFASKWTGLNGSLKCGQWHTNTGSSLVYNPETVRAVKGAAANNVLPAFSRIEPDMDVLEASFMRWLKDRPWKPVASLADLSLWERQGAVMQVQRVSPGVLRLMARQEIEGVQVDFVALIEQADYSLRVQRVRVSAAGRVVEFQLSSELNERPLRLSPAVFYPDRSVPAAKLVSGDIPAAVRPIAPAAVDARKPRLVLYPDASKLVRRVEAFYVLHQAGACRGVPVTVSEQDGGVRVSGQTAPAESPASYFTKIADVSDVMGALSEIRDSNRQSSSQSPSELKTAADRGRLQLLFDAKALEILVVNFDQSQTRLLPDASIHLLESMVQDHTASISKTLLAMRDSAKDRSREPHSVQAEGTTADWRQAVTAVVKGVRALADSGPLDADALQTGVDSLMQTADELNAQVQLELNRDGQSAAMRKSKNEK
jgi:hypothetical protein